MPLEKVRQFLNTMHLQLKQAINAEFDEGGFSAAKQLQMNFSLPINTEMENPSPDGKKSLEWWLYNREQQYFYYVKKTSQGVPLIPENIEYLLKALLPRTGRIDRLNSYGHDTSWAFIMGIWSNSDFFKNTTLPLINKVWALQALSYVMENRQLYRIKQILENAEINKNIAFLIDQYYELFQQDHVILKRCAAVALSYLLVIDPSNTTENHYDLKPVFKVLKEMLSCVSSISDEHMDNAFKIEKELHSRDVRFRAAKALRHLAEKYQIPADVLSYSLGYLDPIKLSATSSNDKKEFYLGPCLAQKDDTIKNGRTSYLKRLYTYENDAIKGHLFNTEEIEYLYYYGVDGDVYCLRALFLAMTINRQIIPRESKGITLKKIATKCHDILCSQSGYTFEQEFAAACFLSSLSAFYVTEGQFDRAMGYLLKRISLTDNQESLIYAQCCIGIVYALQRNPSWMVKYDVEMNQKFDNIRVEILHFLTNYIAANTTNHQLNIQDQLNRLIRNPNLAVAVAARECLNHLLNKHHLESDYDENFKQALIRDLSIPQKQVLAIDTILIMVKNQKADRPNNISANLFTALYNILNSLDHVCKEKVFFIITKLFENACRLKVAFPTETFSESATVQLIQRIQQYPKNDTTVTVIRWLIEYAHKKSSFVINLDYIITRLNLFDELLNSNHYSNTVKNDILAVFSRIIAYKTGNPTGAKIDFRLLMAILLKLLKKREFILPILKEILNIFPPNVDFSSAIFEELILQLAEGKSETARNIQVLLRNYIRDRQVNKLPPSAILQLAQFLQSEQGFVWIKPVLHYLMIEQQYNSNISREALLAFLDTAENEQEEISLFGAELLFHAYPSFIADLSILGKIKASLEKICEKGQSKSGAFLLKALCHVIVFEKIHTDIIDESFENIIAQLISQTVLPIHDREPIYACLATCSTHLTVPLIKQAIKDIQSSEKVAIAAVSFLERMLINLSNAQINDEIENMSHMTAQNSITKSIIYCLVQHMQRPFLMSTILQTFLSLLQKKPLISLLIPQQFIEFSLSLQYETQNNSQNTETAFKIIAILKTQALPETLQKLLEEVFLLENRAKELLSKPFITDLNFINTIKKHATEGKLITVSALKYLIAFANTPLHPTRIPAIISTLSVISKNKQIVLPKITQLLANCLRQNIEVNDICEIIYYHVNDESSLDEQLFALIQEKLDVQEIERSLIIMEVIKQQTFLGKSVTKKTIEQLINLMDVISPDDKPMAAFIISVQIEKNNNLLACFSNRKENRERLLDILILNRSSNYSDLVRLFKKSFPKMARQIADYFVFKEKAILLLHDSKNKITLLTEIQTALTQIKKSDFINRINVKEDITSLVNIILLNALDMLNTLKDTQLLHESLLNILIKCGTIYPDFIPSTQTIEKIHLYTLTISSEKYLSLLIDFMEQFKFSDSMEESIKTNCANLLKYIIRASSSIELIKKAVKIFKPINRFLKEYPTDTNNKTLIQLIKNSNQSALSEKELWLSQALDRASHSHILITHDFYREKISFIVEMAQEAQIELEVLEVFFVEGFSQNDFLNLVKLFELFKDNPDLDNYGWKLSFLINESPNDPRARLGISWLLRSCEVCLILHTWNYEERVKPDLIEALFLLLHQGWDRQTLSQIGNNFLLNKPTHFFEAMLRYKASPDSAKSVIAFSENANTAIQELHKFFVMRHFSETHTAEKSIPKLINDFSIDNPSFNPEKLIELRTFLEQFKEADLGKKIFLTISPKAIQEWTETEFQQWATSITQFNITDILIVINEAIKLWASKKDQYKNTPLASLGLRSAQLLAIKCLLDEKVNVLGQLPTGEGKSIIIAVIALIKALQSGDCQPDIIVTSALFAERDAAEFSDFFALFKTTSAHNNSYETEMKPGVLPCYKAAIVYGSDAFQFDILKDEFKQLGTRGARKQTLGIVDEADSGMLDQATNVAKLADYLPGFDHMEFIYIFIWAQLGRLLNGYTVLLSEPPSPSLKETLYLYKNSAGELLYTLTLPNDEKFKDVSFPINENEINPAIFAELNQKMAEGSKILSVKDTKEILFKNILLSTVIKTEEYYEHARAMDPEHELEEIKQALKAYIDHTLNMTIERKAGDGQKTQKILYPVHLQEYIQSQADTWVNSAIHVFFNVKRNRDYIIRTDDNGVQCIAPVDYSHTGTTLLNTQWSDGVHCFVQLKEGLQLTPEMLTTNFLSNYAFLKRYDQLIGLTGTLGNAETQARLSKMYANKNKISLKCIIFPSHKPKQLFQYEPTLVPNTSIWLEKIIQSIKREVSLGRAVLVVSETIEEVEFIEKALKNTPLHSKVTCFKRSDEDVFETNNIILDSQRILLTTTLGTRGIDPKPLAAVLEKGGVHVIITFLAASGRVFEQTLGRTSRKGDPGTAELIINTAPFHTIFPNPTLSELEEYRDKQEQEKLAKTEKELEINQLKDNLFADFCELLKSLTQKWDATQSNARSFLDAAYYHQFCIKKEVKLLAIIERWGLLLKKIDFSLSASTIKDEFKRFSADIKKDDTDGTLIKNPCYLLQENNNILQYLHSWKHALVGFLAFLTDCHDTILKNCDQITDPLFIAQACAMKAYVTLTANAGKSGTNRITGKLFREAVQYIQDFNFPQLLLQQHFLKRIDPNLTMYGNDSPCDFSQQIENKISVLSTFARAYEQAFKQLDSAQKLIEIKIKNQDAEILTKAECLNKLKQLTQIVNLRNPISLRFHDLRLVYDLTKTVRDEPIQVINAFNEKGLITPPHEPRILFDQKTPAFYHDFLLKLSKHALEKDSKITTLTIHVKRKIKSSNNTEEICEREMNITHLESERSNSTNIVSIIIPIREKQVILTFLSLFYLEIPEAIIEISSLSNTQAVALLEKINLREEEFKKTNIRDISTVFCNPKQYHDVHHLMSNGFYYFFELTERQPLQFYTIALLGTICVAEILVGSLLLVYAAPTVFGVGVAIGLIADGISEAFEIIKVGVTREHNWFHYGIQKTISLALIFATAGISSAAAISSAKAKSAASVAQKSSNIATVKGAELADDITTKTATGMMTGKMTSKTIAQKTLVIAQQEVIKTAVKTVVNGTVNLALEQLGEVFTPHVYAAFERKILNLLNEMVHKTMMEHIIDIKYMLAYAELTHMVGFNFRNRRELEAKIRTDFKQQFASLMSIKSLSLLQESAMEETAKRSINMALMHIFEQQRHAMSIKNLMEVFFKNQHLDTETIQKNTNDVINILSSNQYHIIEAGMLHFLGETLPAIQIKWDEHPHLAMYGNAINALYQDLHRLVYHQSNQERLLTSKSQGVRDVISCIISSALLTEVSKAVNLIEKGVKIAVKSLPNMAFTPSSIYAEKSLFTLETWRHVGQVLDIRNFEGLLRSSGEYLGHFFTKKLTPMKLRTDYHINWVQKRNAFRLSIKRMHGNDGTHQSVTNQLAEMATPEQEQQMVEIMGLSFADRNYPFNESFEWIIQHDGIGKIIAFLKMNHEEIQALKMNTVSERLFKSAQIVFDHINATLSLIFNYVNALYTLLNNFDQPQSESQAVLQSIKYAELLTYEPLWNELAKYADQIPALYLIIRSKIAFFKLLFSAEVLDKLEKIFAWPSEAMEDFLIIVQRILQSTESREIVRQLFNYQNTNTVRFHKILDLFSWNVSNGDINSPLASHLVKAFQTHFPVLLDHYEKSYSKEYADFMRLISDSIWLKTMFEKKWHITFLHSMLLLFDPIENPHLYSSLKNLIPIYGNNSTTLYLTMFGQMAYKNKYFHQKLKTYLNVHYIIFDDLFYNINLALIAYTKLDNNFSFKSVCHVVVPIFRVLNQVTSYAAAFIIIGKLVWQYESLLSEKSLLPTIASTLLYTTLSTAFLKLIDFLIHNTKKTLEDFYPAPKVTLLSSLPTMPAERSNSNLMPLGTNSQTFLYNSNRQTSTEPIIAARKVVSEMLAI